ncbi:MAG TPA: TetR/AcrR family transcriptional regulator [Steroidobacteraceae bacterium]|nr:TetR/AcrR family transcriptional regulator [Steroidobacteraceae bacterium]
MPRPPRSRRRDDPEVRREQIIDQAIRIIGQRGYYGFTIQELAQRCGLSNAGLLYHFGTKDQIFLAVMQELERREIEVIAPLAAAAERQGELSTAGLKAAFAELLHTMLARGVNRPELSRFHAILQSESLDKHHPGHESFRLQESRVLRLFAKLVAPHAPDPRSTARQLLALMQGLALQWLREDQGFDLIAEWDKAIATVVPRISARAKHGSLPAPQSARHADRPPGPKRRHRPS